MEATKVGGSYTFICFCQIPQARRAITMTGYIIPEGAEIGWSDFLPQNPEYLNKLVFKLTDKEEFDRQNFFMILMRR